MHIGVAIFPTDTTIQPTDLAVAVEDRGFESLWFPEHSHIPAERSTPWAGRAGAPPLPEHYWRTHDQFVALAAAAAVTSRLRLATGITLVAQRDPIWLAKEVASLDTISNGRLIFGIGYGWNKEEMRHHGVAYGERRAVLRENVLAMKALWTEDEASFTGEHVSFGPSWSWPKPVQRPHPPIVMGGAPGPKTLAAVVELCDGWMPIHGRHDVEAHIAQLQSLAESAGREPIEVGVFFAPPDAEVLDRLAAAGVARVVLRLPQGKPDEVLRALDDMASLVERTAAP